MTLKKIHLHTALAALIIVVVAGIRLLSNFSTHPTLLANYSPLGAIALFGGAYFRGKVKPFIVPLMVMLISDIILFSTVHKQYGNGFLYDGWYWVYGSILLMTLVGNFLIKKASVKNISIAILIAVAIHWLVSNITSWQSFYPHTLEGWRDCMINGIPFEARFMIATVIYSVIMFGSYEWLSRKYTVPQKANYSLKKI